MAHRAPAVPPSADSALPGKFAVPPPVHVTQQKAARARLLPVLPIPCRRRELCVIPLPERATRPKPAPAQVQAVLRISCLQQALCAAQQ
ncbi:hypothetical protein HRbin30_03239 [bacterium HR30]|nr:hypothetical protein HRbin30_03239 [bacterium HR30]